MTGVAQERLGDLLARRCLAAGGQLAQVGLRGLRDTDSGNILLTAQPASSGPTSNQELASLGAVAGVLTARQQHEVANEVEHPTVHEVFTPHSLGGVLAAVVSEAALREIKQVATVTNID